MKKTFIFVFYLLLLTSVFAQKNSIEFGMTTFNHFDGFGFQTSEGLKYYSYAIAGRLVESIFLSVERSINDKNSLALSFNGFSYTYEEVRPSYRGLYDRDFLNINLQFKRAIWYLWQNRLLVSGQSGINWRFAGGESFLVGYYTQYEPRLLGTSMFDFGIIVGLNARIKVFKGLFVNTQTNFTSYLVGAELWKDYGGGYKSSKNVLSATLSLGYSF
jgi:hypothetical protein